MRVRPLSARTSRRLSDESCSPPTPIRPEPARPYVGSEPLGSPVLRRHSRRRSRRFQCHPDFRCEPDIDRLVQLPRALRLTSGPAGPSTNRKWPRRPSQSSRSALAPSTSERRRIASALPPPMTCGATTSRRPCFGEGLARPAGADCHPIRHRVTPVPGVDHGNALQPQIIERDAHPVRPGSRGRATRAAVRCRARRPWET